MDLHQKDRLPDVAEVTAAETPVLEVAGLTVDIDVPAGELHAVTDVDFHVRRGETFCLVGESGCGKTTLARMMLGILAPSSGEIRLDGTAIAGIDRKSIARRVQPVFQDPYSSLNPRKALAAIISFPLVVHGIGVADERLSRVEEIMELVGLVTRTETGVTGSTSAGSSP